jgi:hypothetical protein
VIDNDNLQEVCCQKFGAWSFDYPH